MSLPLISVASKLLTSRGAFFVMGAFAGPLLVQAFKPVAAASRTALKSSIKGGFVVGKTVQSVFNEAKESISDVAAEAKADLAKVAEQKVVKEVEAAVVSAV